MNVFIPHDDALNTDKEDMRVFLEDICESIVSIVARYKVEDECIEDIREYFSILDEH